jgi:hypothetical protein
LRGLPSHLALHAGTHMRVYSEIIRIPGVFILD